jgi:Tfp pilus assembly protein PilX
MSCLERGGNREERGMALAVAVFALAVIGGLVAGNFVAGLLEQQSGRNTLFGMQAAEAAEAELRAALELVPATSLSSIPMGGAPTLLDSVAFNGVAV